MKKSAVHLSAVFLDNPGVIRDSCINILGIGEIGEAFRRANLWRKEFPDEGNKQD